MVEARIVRCRGGVGAGRALGGALGRLFGRALGRARVGSSAGNSVVRSAGNSVVRSADCEARKGRWQESRLARGVCGDAWVATSVMRGLKAPPAVQSAACGAKCRHRGRPSSRWRRISPLATEISVAIGAKCRLRCKVPPSVSPLLAMATYFTSGDGNFGSHRCKLSPSAKWLLAMATCFTSGGSLDHDSAPRETAALPPERAKSVGTAAPH